MTKPRLGIVTSGSVGWKTVRARWEADLADFSPVIRHIEDHARLLAGFTERYGAKSVGHAAAGRAASASAIAAGARIILLNTLQNAPFVPLREDVAYLVYGDCTTAQLAELYGGKRLGFPGSLVNERLRRLAAHGCRFLCMSRWFANALRDEYGVRDNRLVLLPFYVDTRKWRPLADKPVNARKQALFIGGDLQRKGGDIVYALARSERFREVDFHIVSPDAEEGPDNLHVHRSFRPDSDDLARLAARCDVFVLPTRADTWSIAALEAAACGVPAIITDRGGVAEVVRDGETGVVLPEPDAGAFADALASYLAAPDRLDLHGRNARAHVERHFSKERHMGVLRGAIEAAAADLAFRRAGSARALAS